MNNYKFASLTANPRELAAMQRKVTGKTFVWLSGRRSKNDCNFCQVVVESIFLYFLS